MSASQSIRAAQPLLRISSLVNFRRSRTLQLNHNVRLMSTEGYGDQAGNPISDTPQNQGPRPRVDTEHPGPEPVAEGRVKSAVQGRPVPEDTRGTAGDCGSQGEGTEGKSAAQPKIHSEPQPPGRESLDAKAHNEGMKQRGQSVVAKEDEVVGKGYWKS
ncbi:hypothetical protein BGX38DRAFT_1185928 [Terfezia claveryi]|nr:hypothetical protein BGX38DRAFT_1185928 [Terfezia claveryi]